MAENRNLGLSSFLIYRYVYDDNIVINRKYSSHTVDIDYHREEVKTSDELLHELRKVVDNSTADGKAALALSGGIDSAILAKLMPRGSLAYTFRCVVPGVEVVDESKRAAEYANECGLEHKTIDIYWEDVLAVVDKLMRHKGAPIHSIEAQIYICARMAKSVGINKLIFGESADITYGGMNGLLAKDWTFGEFVDRYAYILPYKALVSPEMPLKPFREFCVEGHIDGHSFINKYFRQESLGSYINACHTAGIEFVGPFAMTRLGTPIDYNRIRAGDTKYLVREVYRKLYPGRNEPEKIPMPRPVNEWFADWDGPCRTEFIPHCTDTMTGDQRWMIWCAEKYLDLVEPDVKGDGK